MSVSSVTLDEILAAAHIRSASLVPETSGYLALAIADASARLPFRLEDSMVHLSTEGTVKVARGTDVVEPEESAATVRDMLARLLARSIGSMPGLANAARPREEAAEGVEKVIGDIEAALVPVNRAAARRALGRLAREAAKARDAGKLRRRVAREARSQSGRDPVPQRRPDPEPAPRRVAATAPSPEPAPRRVAPPAHPEPVRAPHAESVQQKDAHAIDISFSEPPPQVAEGRPTASRFEESRDEGPEPTPTEMGATASIDDPMEPTSIDSVAVVLEQARIAARAPVPVTASERPAEEIALAERELRRDRRGARRREIPGEALFEAAEKRSVDDLVKSFSVSGYDSDGTLRATRATLKRLAGLDATPPPPAIAMRGVTPPPPKVRELESREVAVAPFAVARPTLTAAHVALVVMGLVLAGLLGHYVPTWLDRTGSADTTDKDPSSQVSQRN